MRLAESSDEIVIRHVPFGSWILGGTMTLVFGVCGLWMIHLAATESSNFLGWFGLLLILAFAYVLSIIIFEISFVSMAFAPLVTVVVSRKMKSVDVLRRRFYGQNAERFYFSQIGKFKSHKGKSFFSSEYYLALILANQKIIKLRIPTGDKQNTVKLVKKLNKFVRAGEKS